MSWKGSFSRFLSQLDGFGSRDAIKVIAATNRPDVLDPALLRSGRLDRKIELPHPAEGARAKVLQIHSRKMQVSDGVVFTEIARATEDFNGAQLKAVCVEAGMLALRGERTEISHGGLQRRAAQGRVRGGRDAGLEGGADRDLARGLRGGRGGGGGQEEGEPGLLRLERGRRGAGGGGGGGGRAGGRGRPRVA